MEQGKLTLQIGSIEDMGRRFIEAWRKAERDEETPRDHLTFPDLHSLLSILSARRVSLLQALHAVGPSSILALSRLLKRDYESVRRDVGRLAAVGLIERIGLRRVTVNWTRVSLQVDLRAI